MAKSLVSIIKDAPKLTEEKIIEYTPSMDEIPDDGKIAITDLIIKDIIVQSKVETFPQKIGVSIRIVDIRSNPRQRLVNKKCKNLNNKETSIIIAPYKIGSYTGIGISVMEKEVKAKGYTINTGHGSVINMNNILDIGDWNTKSSDGTLIKRIAKFLHKANIRIVLDENTQTYTVGEKYELSKTAKYKIGMLISEYSFNPKAHYFDITNNFNWKAGDFGDHNSCFWGINSHHRRMMQDNPKFRALRFFKKNNIGIGKVTNEKFYKGFKSIARSWIWKATLTYRPVSNVMVTAEAYVIFNGYGMRTIQQAGLFAKYLNLPFKRIEVFYDGSTTNKLWINDGAYIISEKEVVHNALTLDFKTN